MNHLFTWKEEVFILVSSQEAITVVTSSNTARSTTTSDQKPWDIRSAPYQDPHYKTVRVSRGSFIDESDLGITDKSNNDLQTLLSAKQSVL